MKNPVYIFVTAIVLTAFGCSKHYDCCLAPQPMLTTALRNDSSWTASFFEGAGGYSNMKVSAASVMPLNKNNINDTLVMTINYQDGQSIYKLSAGQVYYHSAVAGGAVKTYQLDTLYTGNVLTVNQYDMHWNLSTGTFALKFINPGKPDITFLNGKFEVPINY